jgi:hypothetical protein
VDRTARVDPVDLAHECRRDRRVDGRPRAGPSRATNGYAVR